MPVKDCSASHRMAEPPWKWSAASIRKCVAEEGRKRGPFGGFVFVFRDRSPRYSVPGKRGVIGSHALELRVSS